MKTLLNIWLKFQERQPVLFGFLLLFFIGYGIYVASNSEIEAFPDLTNVQVQVITQYPGKAAEEVERSVTTPLEVATTGVPGIINQRSISLFGLSVITLTFDDKINSRQARLDVTQKLSDADLPDGVKPSLSPDSTPVGEIFRYTVTGALPVGELRMIEDWQLEKEFKSIPGVADVVSFGGPTRTVDVKLDPTKLRALGLTPSSVAQLLGQSHANAGGTMINHGDEGYIVRSIGLFEDPKSLESAVINTQKNVPVRIRDVGSVEIGHKPRLGIVGRNENDDVVEGIILLRVGADSLETCRQIREKIQMLNSGLLPAGVKLDKYYDRTDLIKLSSHTVFHNVLFGIALVFLVLWFGLGSRFWALIVAVGLIIPFSLLMVFVCLQLFGYRPNLISLGAVDFGIIIETAIFSAEAIIMGLQKIKSKSESRATSMDSFASVLAPALLCAGLLVIAFVPILSLQRVEGRIFRPLGVTLIAALIGGQLGTFLFIPAATRFCKVGESAHSKVEEYFDRILAFFEKISRRLLALPKPLLIFSLSLALAIGLVASLSGREFLPNLNEGALYIRATAPPTISMEAASELAAKIRSRLKEIPEVVDVVSQVGRPDDGTDVNGFDNGEYFVSMVPPDEWKSAKSLDDFIDIAQEKLKDIEGVEFNYSQPIKDNVDEAISGVKGELVVKIFGPQIKELQHLGDEIEKVLKTVPGADDVASEELLGQPELRFQMNRAMLDRYGIRVADAEDVLETALLGKTAAKLTDEQGRAVEIVVKPQLPRNANIHVLSSIPIVTSDGLRVPLSEVSMPSLTEGVSRIYRESGMRRIAVKCSVRNRPVVEFVKEASKKIREKVQLPDKYSLRWSGSFENAERASRQLLIVVPICVLTMIVILFAWFQSWQMVGLLLWEIPFAAIGGLTLLLLFGLNFSISAAAGGIVLIGVTFLTGMMLISEWRDCGDVWLALKQKGRSILLSNGVAIIGLIPAAFSRGIGSETAKPFAVMILGGLISSVLLSLTVLPAIIAIIESRKQK